MRVKHRGRLPPVLQSGSSEFETCAGAGVSEGRNVLFLLLTDI